MALRLAVSFVVILFGLRSATAGVSGENVVVIVNSESVVSRTIANHFIQLREIPESNVIFLDGVPGDLSITLDKFKKTILVPLLEQINSRKIADHVRVIAYSADFPTSVSIGEHTSKLTDPALKKYQLPVASINGLTSLYQFVLSDNPSYLEWGSNLYARGPSERDFQNPFPDAERREVFNDAEKLSRDKSFTDAAITFKELFEKNPWQSPLAIRSAESYAQANDLTAAGDMVRKAVQAGWQSGTYLSRSETLGPIVESDEFKTVMESLADDPTVAQGPIGFASEVAWMANGYPSPKPNDGVRYLLSCILAVVHPRGNTVDEAVSCLERSVQGDRTFPDAKFWFTSTGDVRTKTRFPNFASALLWLGKLGCNAEIIRETMPTEPSDCVGLMLGTPTMVLINKNFNFVPGAIAENLTSYSGAFGNSSQTKITELLQAGAAITSGPVTEPYSLPFKFPSPMMYGYYASGTTAIEAFYLSITSPYQLLIVGDPLAQVFSRPPADRVRVSIFDKLSGEKSLRFQRQVNTKSDPERSSNLLAMELFIDGKLLRRLPPFSQIEMNLKGGPIGTVELRTTLVGRDPTQPRISETHWLQLSNAFESPVAKLTEDGLSVEVTTKEAESIEFTLHGEVVATVAGAVATMTPDRSKLGDGPLPIRPVAIIGEQRVPGKPVLLTAEPSSTATAREPETMSENE